MAFLPAEERPGDRRERLLCEIDPGGGGKGHDVVLHRVEIGSLALEPRALTHGLRDDETDGRALEVLAVVLEKHAARLAQPRGNDAATLVKLERVEQTHDQRRAQV